MLCLIFLGTYSRRAVRRFDSTLVRPRMRGAFSRGAQVASFVFEFVFSDSERRVMDTIADLMRKLLQHTPLTVYSPLGIERAGQLTVALLRDAVSLPTRHGSELML